MPENALYNSALEIKSVTLTLDKARELADALLSVVDSIEFVSRRNYACAAPEGASSVARR